MSSGLGRLLTNKYLLTALAFFVWMFFFDRNDISQQISRVQELSSLKESEKAMQTKIFDTRKELELLKTNPATLEKYAREKYMMKRDNEDLYVISIDSSMVR